MGKKKKKKNMDFSLSPYTLSPFDNHAVNFSRQLMFDQMRTRAGDNIPGWMILNRHRDGGFAFGKKRKNDRCGRENILERKLIIKIHSNGMVESETKGILGKKCMEYMPVLEQMANARIVESEFTSDYYATIETVVEEESILTSL